MTYGRTQKLDLSKWPTVFVTLAICAFCWILGYHYSIGYPVVPSTDASPLWSFICKHLPGKAYTYIIGIVCLTVISLLLQRSNYHMVIIRKSTRLPFLFFFLTGSTNFNFLPFHEVSIAMLLFIAALFELFRSQQTMESGRAFNAFVFIGAGSLIWIYLLWFIPLYWYGMYKFKLLDIKNFFSTILGVLTVYWFVLGWCIWQHDFTSLSVPFGKLTDVSIAFPQIDYLQWINIVGALMLTVLIYIYISFNEFEHSLHTRQILSYFFVFSPYIFGIFFLYSKHNSPDFLYFFYLPMVLLAAYILSNKQGIITFILYYIFLIALLLLAVTQVWFM